MASIDLTELNASLGAYCREYSDVIKSLVLLAFNIKDDVTLMDGISDEMALTQISSNSIVKPFKQAFEPTPDAIGFVPRIVKTRACKVDIQIFAKELHKTWLGMYKQPGSSAYNLPFEAFIMQRIVEQAKADIEIKALFNGVYDAVGTDPEDCFNGWKTILETETLTNAPVAITAITASNAIAQLEKVADAVPSKYSALPMNMYISHSIFQAYQRDYRQKFGTVVYNTGYEKTMIDGTNIKLTPVNGLIANDRVILTTKDNMILGVDTEADMGALTVEKEKRNINVLMDFNVGVQFATLDTVFYGKTA